MPQPSRNSLLLATLLCMAFVLSCPLAAHTAQGQDAPLFSRDLTTLRVGYFQAPPHAYQLASGQAAGAAVEMLVRHVAPEMQISIEMAGPYPFARLLNDFESRGLDAILMLSKTPERETHFVYPTHPFGTITAALAVRNSNPMSAYVSGTRFDSKRVGTVRGAWMPADFLHSGARFEPTTGESATVLNLQKLVNDRVEIVFCPDTCILIQSINQLSLDNEVRVIPMPEATGNLYTVFGRHLPKDIINRYDAALRKVLAVTSYQKLKQKHLQSLTPPLSLNQ
ncbi:transporter substrate-binding domain-containing protein [Desulfovibrio mangrovi]|uniref:substrate-binding periplasmic protein n=1 Tax=Desulfovibrio mangrovi TaxID=2976983 RepID=UPI002246D9BA|nr:transporter substrate-binding domain-containing protein [Desulfovibrio mangrovi]UZP67168.1 transporter substrate-binding domain-containing protein [Desulfovibrio mangrovi]